MKKPKYQSDIYAFIFLILGLGFITIGCLSFINIIKPSAHSAVQDQNLFGQIFCFIGATFFLIQIAFKFISYKQGKLHNELISTGTKIVGTIEKISLRKEIKVVGRSPYVAYYTYSYKEKVYYDKSYLLWYQPNLSKGDRIDVFVNDNGQSAIVL